MRSIVVFAVVAFVAACPFRPYPPQCQAWIQARDANGDPVSCTFTSECADVAGGESNLCDTAFDEGCTECHEGTCQTVSATEAACA